MHTYKVAIIGPSGSGKSSYIERCISRNFQNRYTKTPNNEIHSLVIQTNKDAIEFKLYDIVEELDKIDTNMDGFIILSDAAFYDESVSAIRNIHADIPIVLCKSKCDMINSVNDPIQIYDIPYYSISSKNDINCLKPILHLARILSNDPTLYIPEYKISDSPKFKRRESLLKIFNK